MSRPIDIPLPPVNSSRIRHEIALFPTEDGPYFGYIEVMKDGTIMWAVSSGLGRFVKVGPRRDLPPLAFIVEKDRILKKITIEITSMSLKQTLQRAITDSVPASASQQLDFEVLLKNYETLKSHLGRIESQRPHAETTAEARLLVTDLLLESNLYDGIGMEGFRQRNVLCDNHLQDIHQRNLDLGLDEIQDYFSLGLVPDQINEEYMEALNEKYAQLARSGDLHGMQNLCEPIVRSGEISLQYNPSLLLEVLENEDYELYQYMLSLVERTRDDEAACLDQELPDVTFDPFNVAIRLGRSDLVRNFISENAYFEGKISGDSVFDFDCLMTPLTSSVLWRQPEIARLLLASEFLYLSSYPQAMALAINCGHDEMKQVLENFDYYTAPAPLGPSGFIPPFGSQNAMVPMHVNNSHLQLSSGRTTQSHDGADYYMPPFTEDTGMTNAGLESVDIDPQVFTSWASNYVVQPEVAQASGSSIPHITIDQSQTQSIASTETLPVMVLDTQLFARQTSSHQARRKVGQSFAQRLEMQFSKLVNLCSEHGQEGEYVQLRQCFTGVEDIWATGISTFKGIYRNRVPVDLFEMICCLLVADAVSMQVSPSEPGIHSKFVDDLSRWRAVVLDEDKRVFDEIASAIWHVEPLSNFAHSSQDSIELPNIQNFLQDLVSVDKVDSRLPKRSGRQGVRLQAIYDRKPKENEADSGVKPNQMPQPWAAEDFPYLNNLSDLPNDAEDHTMEDIIQLEDFIYIDILDTDSIGAGEIDHQSSLRKCAWNNVKSTITVLLASVAFSIILSFLNNHHSQTWHGKDPVASATPGPTYEDFVYAPFKQFFSFEEPDTTYVPDVPTSQAPASHHRKYSTHVSKMREISSQSRKWVFTRTHASARKPSRGQSGCASTDSPGSSSLVSTDLSSTDTPRSPQRLRCLSHNCPKAFSSVSNRNKHMREGCAFRDNKGGYTCRNANCTKVLTTKWYRNTHEQTRCRFR